MLVRYSIELHLNLPLYKLMFDFSNNFQSFVHHLIYDNTFKNFERNNISMNYVSEQFEQLWLYVKIFCAKLLESKGGGPLGYNITKIHLTDKKLHIGQMK